MMLFDVHRQQGATLVELMVSLVIGLVIVAGLGQVFLSGKGTSSLQARLGDMQENGRYAIAFLQRDIRNAGQPLARPDQPAFVPPGGGNSTTADGGGNVPDRIAIRFIPIAAGTDCLGQAYAANATVVMTYSIDVDVATQVSRLMCRSGANFQPMLDGIENMQILYGVDSSPPIPLDQDYIIDTYIPANEVNPLHWNSRVLAVRIAILASTITPIAGDVSANNARTYNLLDAPAYGPIAKNNPPPSGDLVNLRGNVFTTTVEIRNRTRPP